MTYSIFKAKLKMLEFNYKINDYRLHFANDIDTFNNKIWYVYIYNASKIKIVEMTSKGDILTFKSYQKALNFIINIDK